MLEHPVSTWGRIDVERVGGLAGYGAPGSRIRSRCSILASNLSAADQAALQALFLRPPRPPQKSRDAFSYRLTRQREDGPYTVVVAESDVPNAIRDCVRDEILPP